MGKKSLHKAEIERLVDVGYNTKQIATKLGLHVSTVNRHLNKLRREARYRFNDLMSKDYLYQYFGTLDNFAKTEIECNEQIAKVKEEYDEQASFIRQKIDALEGDERKAYLQMHYMQSLIQLQDNTKSKIGHFLQIRDNASHRKNALYNAGPVVHAIDMFVNTNKPTPIEATELNFAETNLEESEEGVEKDERKV